MDLLSQTIIYLLSGCLVGTLAGLLGIGGGILIVPILLTIFSYQQVSPNNAMHLAVGTSLAIMIITAAMSAYNHYQRGAVALSVVKRFLPGVLIGCLFGVIVASHLQSDILKKLFGLLLLLISLQMFFNFNFSKNTTGMPSKTSAFFASIIISTLSGMLGVGGGIFIIPYFSWHGMKIRNAIATSTACVLPVAIIGTISYANANDHSGIFPPYTSGYINWPAFLAIGITGALTTPIGVRIAHHVPSSLLRRAFAVFLVFISFKMLFF